MKRSNWTRNNVVVVLHLLVLVLLVTPRNIPGGVASQDEAAGSVEGSEVEQAF